MNMIDKLKHLDNVEEYTFKRDAYYKLQKVIDEGTYRIIGLTGPRRCGKTIIFKQLKETYGDKAVYINCKQESEDSIDEVFVRIYKDEPGMIFLLDEVTYIDNFDSYIGALDSELHHATVVVTGSQSAAISRMLSINFASMAYDYRIGFLTFNEYLRFIGKIDLGELRFSQILDIESLHGISITEQDCYDFVYGGYSFNTAIQGMRSYLKGCLDETVQSCKTSMQGLGNYLVKDIEVSNILTVMYALLFKLHNNVGTDKLMTDGLYRAEKHYLKVEQGIRLNSEVYESTVSSLLKQYYLTATNYDSVLLRKCVAFLRECDLIVFTLHYPEGQSRRKVLQWLNGDLIMSFDDVMSICNITFKYPNFVSICLRELSNKIENIMGIGKESLLTRGIFGSIIECEVKRYMSAISESRFIYDLFRESSNTESPGEVDYYDPILSLAVEITVKNKSVKDTHFGKFECCRDAIRILLSKDKLDVLDNGIIRIPYYTFLAVISSSVI